MSQKMLERPLDRFKNAEQQRTEERPLGLSTCNNGNSGATDVDFHKLLAFIKVVDQDFK